MRKDRLRRILLPLILPLIIIIVWTLITSYSKYIPPYLLPSPADVFRSFLILLSNGELIEATAYTISRVIIGILLSIVVAIPLGICMGWSRTIKRLTGLSVGVLRPIPPIAWIPFAILWFGVGIGSEIFIIFIGSVFPILLNTIDGVKRTDPVLIETAYTLGAGSWQTLLKVAVPAALPSMITGVKIGIGIGLMCTVAAEMIGANDGLGYLILTSISLLNSSSAIVGMITIGLIGILADYLFHKLEKEVDW